MFAQFNAATYTLADMDAELRAVQKYTVLAQQKRNSLVAACMLPAEILSNIFRRVQRQCIPPREISLVQSASTCGWMALAHVCSRWRKVAIDDSTLWRHIDCLYIHPRALHTILFRAGKMPLRMRFRFPNRPTDGGTPVLSLEPWLSPPVCPRIETLSITFDRAKVLDSLPHRMPHLKYLELYYTPRGAPITHHWTKEDLFYPELTHLYLTNFTAPWDSQLFTPTLTHLNWRLNHQIDESPYVDVRDFPRLLARTPKLESLVLENAIAMRFVDSRGGTRYAIPSCLKSIRLESNDEFCVANLLSSIQLPATTTVAVELYEIGSASQVCTIGEAIFQDAFAAGNEPRELMIKDGCFYVRSSSPSPLPSRDFLNFTRTMATYTDFEPGSRCLIYQVDEDDEQDSVDLEVNDDVRTLGNANLYLPCIPFASIVCLTICQPIGHAYPAHYAPTFWSTAFNDAPNVRSLYMPLTDQVAHLCLALEETESGSKGFLVFPQLEVITLGKIYWKDHIPAHSAQICIALALASALEKRREGGAPVREVRAAKEAEFWEGDPWIGIREFVQLSFFD